MEPRSFTACAAASACGVGVNDMPASLARDPLQEIRERLIVDVEVGRGLHGPLPVRIAGGKRATREVSAGRESQHLSCFASV